MLNLNDFNIVANKEQVISNVEVAIDTDPSLKYEAGNFFTKILSFFIAFFLSLIPAWLGSFLLGKTTKKGKSVKDKATTYYALDTIYTSGKLTFEKGIIRGITDYLWFQLENTRAARNRLKLVKKILKKTTADKLEEEPKNKVSVLSLGSGSARAIIGITKELKGPDNLSIYLLDKDQNAIDFSKKLISEHKIRKNNFSFIVDTVRNFNKYCDNCPLDVIEMVGMLDYFDDDKAIEIFKKIYDNLPEKGYLITANIKKNKESAFVTKTVKWPMVYREPEDLIRVLVAAGFKNSKMKIILEPLKIHIVAVCQK